MTETSLLLVKELLGNSVTTYSIDDTTITNFIAYSYIVLKEMTQQTVTGDSEEILHRWLTAHLVLKRTVLSGLGRDVSNINAGGFSYTTDSNPTDAIKANVLWTEFVDLLRTFSPSSVYVREAPSKLSGEDG